MLSFSLNQLLNDSLLLLKNEFIKFWLYVWSDYYSVFIKKSKFQGLLELKICNKHQIKIADKKMKYITKFIFLFKCNRSVKSCTVLLNSKIIFIKLLKSCQNFSIGKTI